MSNRLYDSSYGNRLKPNKLKSIIYTTTANIINFSTLFNSILYLSPKNKFRPFPPKIPPFSESPSCRRSAIFLGGEGCRGGCSFIILSFPEFRDFRVRPYQTS